MSEKYSEEIQNLARIAKAMGHPARLEILKVLNKHNACFCGNIVDELPLSQSTVSQHLKELKSAGLIQGEIDPPKVRYCINEENWNTAKILFDKFFDLKGSENGNK
jgi:ArsR family transcriptional regulator